MGAHSSVAWSRGEARGAACPPRPPVLRGLRGGEPGRNAPDRARAARAAPGRGEGRASERVRADPISRAARARGVAAAAGEAAAHDRMAAAPPGATRVERVPGSDISGSAHGGPASLPLPVKVRSAICWEPRQPLVIDEIDLEGPRAGECLVRLVATGVCHTDAYTMSGRDPSGLFPAVLGHEGGGVVEEVGPGVTSLRPGDHVIPLYIPECRQCEFCLSGRTNLCGALLATQGKGLMPDGTSRLSHRGRMLHHYMGTSTFAEWTVVPEIALAKVRSDAPLDKVCLLGCGITTGIGAVLNTARVHPGASVAVFGLGGVGLSAIQGAVMAGAGRIIGIDTNPRKFAMARQLGATDVLDPATVPSVAEAVVEMTRGGVDFSFECIGDVEVMAQALASAHKGWGQAIIIGVAGAGEEKGLAYEPVLLSFEKGEHKSPQHLARSPHGKVPALEDDGVSLYESSAIVEYLEERYPRTPLLPPDPAARAAVRIEELECLLYFTERFFPLARHVFFTPPDKRDPAAIEAARAEVRRQLGQLEARAVRRKGEYLVGALSRADFTWLPFVEIAARAGVDLDRGATPWLVDWRSRMRARPG